MKLGVVLDLVSGRMKQHTVQFFETTDAVTTPTANKLVKADSYGKIVAAWIGDVLGIAQLPVATDGEVSSTKVVRADDSRLGNPTVGGDLSGTAGSATVVKIRNRPLSTAAPSDRQVLTYNDTLSQWEPATSTTGASVSVTDGVTTVANVTTIHAASITDNGGGSVTIAGSTGTGSGKSAATRVFLYRNYR